MRQLRPTTTAGSMFENLDRAIRGNGGGGGGGGGDGFDEFADAMDEDDEAAAAAAPPPQDELVPVDLPGTAEIETQLGAVDPENDKYCYICSVMQTGNAHAMHDTVVQFFDEIKRTRNIGTPVAQAHSIYALFERMIRGPFNEAAETSARLANRPTGRMRPWTPRGIYNHFRFHDQSSYTICTEAIRQLRGITAVIRPCMAPRSEVAAAAAEGRSVDETKIELASTKVHAILGLYARTLQMLKERDTHLDDPIIGIIPRDGGGTTVGGNAARPARTAVAAAGGGGGGGRGTGGRPGAASAIGRGLSISNSKGGGGGSIDVLSGRHKGRDDRAAPF